jgi:hypothetical protein
MCRGNNRDHRTHRDPRSTKSQMPMSAPQRLLRVRSKSALTMASPGLKTQQSGDECVDILANVIKRQRRPDGRLQAEAA